MSYSKVHCFFEQSGTFRDVFLEHGIEAYDYDIEDDFGKTDFKVDLFEHIDRASAHSDFIKDTVFQKIGHGDLVFAFFPCTFFSDQSQLNSRGDSYGQKDWMFEGKIEYSRDMMNNRAKFYERLCNLVLLACQLDFPLIIENPYGKAGFLRQYFPIKPDVVNLDRRLWGDVYRKPTQFFFINCNPVFNLESEYTVSRKRPSRVVDSRGIKRSIISREYARFFIETFVLEEK